MAKKETAPVVETGYNPLLKTLKENDKKNLFKTNVVTAFHKTGFHLYDYYLGSLINIHDDNGNFLHQDPRVGQAAGTFNMFVGGSGSGKALPNFMRIPSPDREDGYIYMEDIKVGDRVFGRNGKPVNVVGVYPQGKKQCYCFELHDGRTVISSEDHLWNIIGESRKEYTYSTEEIYDMYNNGNRIIIPVVSSPVQYEPQNISICPYTLGVFMAMGHRIFDDNCLKVTHPTTNRETLLSIALHIGLLESLTVEELSSETEGKYTFAFKVNDDPDTNEYVTPKEFFRYLLSDYSYFSEQMNHIPNRYKHNTKLNRLEFIRGVFDYAAKINTDTGMVEIDISNGYNNDDEDSINFWEEFMYMLYSMGLLAKKDKNIITVQIPSNQIRAYFMRSTKSYEAYSLWKHTGSVLKNEIIGLEIVNIKKLNEYECTCIKVDSPDSLFLCKDYIVTHNTTLAVQVASNIIRQYKSSQVIHYDCEQRIDLSRIEIISKLPSKYFNDDGTESSSARYILKAGAVGLDTMQEMIVKLYAAKMKAKDTITIDTGVVDEFNRPVKILEPTVIIIDSITSVLSETFSPDNAKEVSDAEKLRGNTEGARDSKSLKGFFKDILPLCKDANIIILAINHINVNMSMNAFVPVAKQQNFLKQDEIIPGGKSLIYYAFNIIKMVSRPGDDFTKEGDGFEGHMVMLEPIKSSTNQSGNNSKGVSFTLCFNFNSGFDPLRSLVIYARERGIIEGNRNRLKFKDDPNNIFSFKTLYKDIKEKPFIMENIKKYIFPVLKDHLSFVEPDDLAFHEGLMDY